MKIDRILEIIIYLLNHDKVSAKTLAEKYHVSVRTIQRDMVNIASSGIPVYSDNGKNGGYSILPTYKLRNANIKNDEQKMIMKALESLSTSYTNQTLDSIIEKYNSIIGKEGGQRIFWDFGVTKENQQVQNVNKILEQAIAERRYISFHYRNASGQEYFPDCPIEKLNGGMCRIFIGVPAKERLWKALLLSFGDRVKVVAPEDYKRELIATAEKFLSNYDS